MDEGEVAALEDLSGFNLSLDRNVFQSEEAQLTRSRLSKWVAGSNLEVTTSRRRPTALHAHAFTYWLTITTRSETAGDCRGWYSDQVG